MSNGIKGTQDDPAEASKTNRASHYETIGKMLRRKRKALGLTLQQMAQIIGVNYTTISKWENGWVLPNNVDRVKLLVSAYNLNESERKKLCKYALGYKDILESDTTSLEPIKTETPSNTQLQVRPTDIILSIRTDKEGKKYYRITLCFKLMINAVHSVHNTVEAQKQSKNLVPMTIVPRGAINLIGRPELIKYKNNGGLIVGNGPEDELISQLKDMLSSINKWLSSFLFGGIKITFTNGVQIAAYSSPDYETNDRYTMFQIDLRNNPEAVIDGLIRGYLE